MSMFFLKDFSLWEGPALEQKNCEKERVKERNYHELATALIPYLSVLLGVGKHSGVRSEGREG